MNKASDGGVTPVGQVNENQSVQVFLYSDDVQTALITGLQVTPSGGPFRVTRQACVGHTVDGIAPGTEFDAPNSLRRCVLSVAFAPRAPAPSHADSPYQGYYHGLLVFDMQATCVSRLGTTCAQIPSDVVVDRTHPRTVSWQRADDLWGATQCPLPNPNNDTVNGCDLAPLSNPVTEPSAPTTEPSIPTVAPTS